jgi:hypothetical protein
MKIFVKAKPGVRKAFVERLEEGLFGAKKDEAHFVVAVTEPPVDGRANRAIEKAIAEHFHVPSSRVRIIAGHTVRNKVLEIP